MKKQDIQDLFDVGGKIALITGATGGFGKAATIGLAAAGAKVMATARTLSALELLVKEIRAEGGQAAFSVGIPFNTKTSNVWSSIPLIPTAV